VQKVTPGGLCSASEMEAIVKKHHARHMAAAFLGRDFDAATYQIPVFCSTFLIPVSAVPFLHIRHTHAVA